MSDDDARSHKSRESMSQLGRSSDDKPETPSLRVDDGLGNCHSEHSVHPLGTQFVWRAFEHLRMYAGTRCVKLRYSKIRSSLGLRGRHNFPTSGSGSSVIHQHAVRSLPRSERSNLTKAATQYEEEVPDLIRTPPYWDSIKTRAKGRWQGRTIYEVLSTEFRERSSEYYVCMRHTYTIYPAELALWLHEDSGSP